MCDTLAYFSREEPGRSFFAKNSDRDPGEPQIIEWAGDAVRNFHNGFLDEKLKKYTEGPFRILQKVFPGFSHPYGALLSRPLWIWGAEMGLNEKGVAIGNEAVFSHRKLQKDGLLGMDILRLALHNAADAGAAAVLIIELLEKYGQGGNGSYSGTLKYHNSFLIKDPQKILVLESAGKQWALKEVSGSASVSNSYSRGTDYQKSPEGMTGKNLFAKQERRLVTFFGHGRFRQKYTSQAIENRDKSLLQLFSLMRSHINAKDRPAGGMKSICVHPGWLVKSETTSSFVADFYNGARIVWHTSAPNPCVALYKPVLVYPGAGMLPLFADRQRSKAYFLENRRISEFLLKHHSFFEQEVRPLRDQTERQFVEMVYTGFENKSPGEIAENIRQCYLLEKDYLNSIRKRIKQKP